MKRVFRLLALYWLSSALILPNAWGLSAEDIERRLLQLEQENSALKAKLEQLESRLKTQSPAPQESLIEQRVSANEESNRKTAQNLDTFQRSVTRVNDDADRVKLAGFMSAGFSMNDETGGLKHQPYGFNEHQDFESDSALGLQVTFEINDQARAVTQLVANGWDLWEPDIGWAFLAYDVDEQVTLRAGRMRLPLYYMSESLDVGYSYPWVRPPLTLYTTEISNYDGFDATFQPRFWNSNHRISAFVGTYSFEENQFDRFVEITGDDAFGVNWTTYWEDWTFRSAYTHLRSKAAFTANIAEFLPPGSPPFARFAGELSETVDFYTFATAYDDGTWMALAEVGVIEVSEGNFIGDEVQGHFTLGRHYDRWMPYAGFGREYYKQPLNGATAQFARARDRDYKLGFVGMRYEIADGISAKLEMDHFYDFKGTVGPFENADAATSGASFDEVDLYTFLVDAVF